MQYDLMRADLERILQKKPLLEGESLVDVLARLDACAQGAELPERLQHYLSKRSYQKALDWLDDPSLPHQL
ncbi:hypothetical protein [Coraliomargarita akajimensis]|uniref:Uncharacterized protein n=1 Tax=Coraliomargarita akajimensis (strain DSM 45221 / IAM 15411 / JCM 23193 / KCTC 12865 / 04OKA010-24) TaxID=583355 RepID=D5EHS0_CORAD|nr:hypothetical protein [Coraliomargarita akajimensis]ADE54111.1 hypothetical protein Caka_1090 [Coraliomargarita akajimensis DSM 45221]